MPTATPYVSPVETSTPSPVETPTPYPFQPDANLYHLAEGEFTITIPAGWNVAGPIPSNGYNLYRFGPDPSASGGPDSGQVIIADSAALTIEQFAQQMCSVCPTNPIEDVTVGRQPAKRTLIDGGSAPAREWYFVTYEGKLIGLSFIPAGDEFMGWVVNTLRFDSFSAAGPIPDWVPYWDDRYGYGLAVPCWWVVEPGILRSYDDAFYAVYSNKSGWIGTAPAGAVKIDLAVIEGIDPNAATEDAILNQIGLSKEDIVSIQSVDVNGHIAFLVEFQHTNFSPVAVNKSYYFRLAPDKLMMFNAYPADRLESGDAQAILYSIALSKDESIAMPAAPPAPPLIEVPESCR